MSYKKKLINGEALLKVAKGLKEKIQSENIDVSRLEGVIDLENLPKGAVERLYVVENDWGRFSLTKEQVQNGDTVKVNSTQKMYFVVDDTKLNLSSGYTEYTVGKATAVDWNGVENKPTEFTPKAHTQGSDTITDMIGYETKNADYISSSDTLNQAIGKLEGALQTKQNSTDSELKTSDKTIVGAINENKRLISMKENYFSKNSAFNKSFGVTKNTVLEGSNFGKLENKINLKQNKVDSSLKTNNKNIVDAINEVKTEVGTKESKFSKNSAFNKSFGTSSNTVLEGNRYGELVSKINSGDTRLQSNINSKEDKFIKNSAFNKNFGTSDNTVLEGSKYNDLEGKINDSETRLNSKINTKEPSFVKQSAFNKPFGTSKGTVLEGEIYKIIEKNKEQTSQLQTTKQDKIDNNLKTLTTKNIVEILNGNQGNYQGMNIMDCNTPVVPGFYHVHKTAKNNPIKDWTVLQITCEVGAFGSRRETVYSILDPRIQYVRSYVNGKYSNWEKIPSQQEINSLETKKQNKTDNSLKTSNKNVVGAINEVYQKTQETPTDVYTKKETNEKLLVKQDKEDNNLTTSSKNIVGAINEINAKPSGGGGGGSSFNTLYKINIEQSPHQTISVKVIPPTEVESEDSFSYSTLPSFKASVEGDVGYSAGVLNYYGGLLNQDITIKATPAKEQEFEYYVTDKINDPNAKDKGGIKYIGKSDVGNFFYNDYHMKGFESNTATTFGERAFSGCTNLTDVNLPNTTTFGERAFSGCTNLTDISLPSATTFGNSAFRDCTNLTDIFAPNVITSGTDIFSGLGGRGCKNLKNIIARKALNILYGTKPVPVQYIHPDEYDKFTSSSKETLIKSWKDIPQELIEKYGDPMGMVRSVPQSKPKSMKQTIDSIENKMIKTQQEIEARKELGLPIKKQEEEKDYLIQEHRDISEEFAHKINN